MGCTDSHGDYAREPQQTQVYIRRISMEAMQIAQRLGHWIELAQSGSLISKKLVNVRSIDAQEVRDDGFYKVSFFQFTCVDQSGFKLVGAMIIDEVHPDHAHGRMFDYVEEWGKPIPIWHDA